MPVQYKINVLAALKEKGYTTSRIRKEKLIGEATVQRLRHNQSVSYEVLAKLCELLDCQPGDILEYVPDEKD
ncbi:MAG: helix-turn-helix transcriptional regulator [Oscillospiraceae bacterium]|nr:helix-turn-helix transcriptional regulator [Oscillospiraceae bacterium]